MFTLSRCQAADGAAFVAPRLSPYLVVPQTERGNRGAMRLGGYVGLAAIAFILVSILDGFTTSASAQRARDGNVQYYKSPITEANNDAYNLANQLEYGYYGCNVGKAKADHDKMLSRLESAAADLDRYYKREYGKPPPLESGRDLIFPARGRLGEAYDKFLSACADWETEKGERARYDQFYFFLLTLKNSGQLRLAETLAATGQQTFGSTDKVDPLGVGFGIGYNFVPWNNAIRLGAFASFDVLNQTINHTFPAGTFIGTRSHWIATAGMKLGFATAPGPFVYALAGVALLNQDLNINFGGPFVTSSNTTVPGATAGVGVEFAPSILQRFGRPVSMFVQYQHTWWQDAHLNQPAASPLFNYAFRRDDDTIKAGVNIYFGASTEPPAPPARKLIIK